MVAQAYDHDDRGWFSTRDPDRVFRHELGHYLNQIRYELDVPVSNLSVTPKCAMEDLRRIIDDPNWRAIVGLLPGPSRSSFQSTANRTQASLCRRCSAHCSTTFRSRGTSWTRIVSSTAGFRRKTAMTTYRPQCLYCERFSPRQYPHARTASPRGIPEPIIPNEVSHRRPYRVTTERRSSSERVRLRRSASRTKASPVCATSERRTGAGPPLDDLVGSPANRARHPRSALPSGSNRGRRGWRHRLSRPAGPMVPKDAEHPKDNDRGPNSP